MTVKMIQYLEIKLEAKTNKLQETLSKEIEDLRIKQAEVQIKITEINSMEEFLLWRSRNKSH